MSSKPIIDVAVAIASLSEVDRLVEYLKLLGYEYRGEHDPQHLFVQCSEVNHKAYLHIIASGSD